ncbi:MAG: hypothetical protein CVV13_09570 [Gammaproteobacteria bacterium HGW-Gammaproteobacteria-3]|jgi:hypothetical protein|nr:MAG: hypothetical protein CVV13_09570 [Gammaproteobacteria bacterium HGW-Gammaproteobacteria-3]
MFEIEYEFREEDLIHFNEIEFMRSDEIQKSIRKNRLIVPGMLALIGAFYYFYYHNFMSAGYAIGIALLWSLLSPKIIMLDLRRQILNNYTPKEKINLFGAYTLTIEPQFLLEKSPSGKNKMAWSELVRVEREGKRYVYIYISLNTALVIPVETVKKGNLDEFVGQAEKMIERLG